MKEVVMRKEYDDEDEIPERRHSSGKKKKKFGWVNVLTILLVVVLVAPVFKPGNAGKSLRMCKRRKSLCPWHAGQGYHQAYR